MTAEPQSPPRPWARKRVIIPLALLAGTSIAFYLILSVPRSGPFGPMLSPPPIQWTPSGADEVTLWAWQTGMDHYQTGAFEEASSLFGRAAAGLPSHPQPAFFAGVCHLLVGRPGAAADLLQRAVDLTPEEAQFLYYLAWAEWLDDREEAAAAHLQRASEGDDRWARRARKAGSRLAR